MLEMLFSLFLIDVKVWVHFLTDFSENFSRSVGIKMANGDESSDTDFGNKI